MKTPEIRNPIRADELRDAWPVLAPKDRVMGFLALQQKDAEEFFLGLNPDGQATIITGLPAYRRRLWMRLLAPDDAADLLQEVDGEFQEELLKLLDEPTRREVRALLAYAEDVAGGLMSPRFARVRPEISVDEALRYLRKQARDHLETIYYAYVLDSAQHLMGVVSLRELFVSPPEPLVQDIMHKDVVTVPEDMDQEAVSRIVARHGFLAVPVVDAQRRMKGIVTLDDIVDAVEEEATEDAQKLGGMEALDTPYLQTRFLPMLRKRAGWLSVLFLGEMLTASAMGHYEEEIARAVVLALFVPMIISSGGNSGAQASTLVIRAMALGQIKLKDWWHVIRREILYGFSLGAILGVIGFLRVVAWQVFFDTYGPHYLLVAMTVAISLVGVATWGTVAGSLLPFVLRAARFDPATASAPFIATLVDVSGLIIYFQAAHMILGNTLM